MASPLQLSKTKNSTIVKHVTGLEMKCWTNEQYSRCECVEVVGISFFQVNIGEWIYSCVLCWNWFTYIRKCLCKSICKVEVDQEASEASWMELFTAEVSDWKLLTIDVEDFVSDVTWYLDLSLNKYYYVSWNFCKLTTPFCSLPALLMTSTKYLT